MGVVDLLQSADKVKRRQIGVARKIARSANDPHRRFWEKKLEIMFPELAELRPA